MCQTGKKDAQAKTGCLQLVSYKGGRGPMRDNLAIQHVIGQNFIFKTGKQVVAKKVHKLRPVAYKGGRGPIRDNLAI